MLWPQESDELAFTINMLVTPLADSGSEIKTGNGSTQSLTLACRIKNSKQ